jgi:hypothetical protein
MKRNSFTTSWRDLMRCSFELVQYERAPVRAIAVDIAEQIRHQYTLGYTPLDRRLDGSYRTIRVKVSGPDRYEVRTRNGYRATP